MALHRRQLPIADPCEGFEPAPGSEAGGGGFCTRCRKQVHDVSSMRESELRRLLTSRTTPTVCLAYRVDAHGRIQLRPEPRLRVLALAAVVGLMAACAGHGAELEIPGSPCVDASGYEVVCGDPSAIGMVSVPEGPAASSSRGPAPGGCPIRPTGRPPHGTTTRPEDGSSVVDDGSTPPSASGAQSDGGPEVGGTSAKMRVDFSVDPDDDYIRGVVVVGTYEDRDFVPTEDLLEDARQRRIERRRHRRRGRGRRSVVSR